MPGTAVISTLDREASLDRLERETFDCVIIGGGITGAGVAREAARRGMTVALLEAEDFAAGTSSRSSKLIHGGLRYLAMGDLWLVRETARERTEIHKIAPHLAEPRWIIVPSRSRAGSLKVRAGVSAYERLGNVESQDLHQNWSEVELQQEEPIIRHSTFRYACVYREYITDDARLVLANIRAAVADGAAVSNHTPVRAILREGDRANGVEARCRFTGRTVRIRGRSVINAAGPWVDAVRALEDPEASALLHLSKGIHLVLSGERIPLRNILILGAPDGRTIFAIPRAGMVWVGTTDTTYTNAAAVWPEITSEDVEYLLGPLPHYLALDPVKPEEVLGAWAGLRPLIAEPGKKPHEISRRDEILVGPASVVTIAGGKLTGYRMMARRTVEKTAEIAGLSVPPATDEEPPLPGGDFEGDLDRLAAALVSEGGASAVAAQRLVRLYGREAKQVIEGGFHPVVEGASAAVEEIDWAVQREGAATLEDVLQRRMRLALYDPALGETAVEPVARRMAELLGWDASRCDDEVAAARARIAHDLAFSRGDVG
jgi:glycerol-3-phosphate dehydrogenase